VVGLHLGHGSAHGALRAREAERHQLLEGHVGADLGVRALDPLLDLGHEGIDETLPALGLAEPGQLAGISFGDPVGHGVMGTAGELTGMA
jgi:hypothetical protein